MRICTIILTLLSLGCVRDLGPENICGFIEGKSGRRVSWGKNVPIDVEIHSSVPSEARESILRAVNTWNKAVGYSLIKVVNMSSSATIGEPEENAIFWYTASWDRDPREQASCSLAWTGTIIYDADIKINNFNFDFAYNDSGLNINTVDLESLMLHELGHLLGLDHSDNSDSVMQRSLAAGEKRRELSDSDVFSVSCEY